VSATPVSKAILADPSLFRAPNVEALGMDMQLLVRGRRAKSTIGSKSASNWVISAITNPHSSTTFDRWSA
jgi:hypothetical protein